jgi:hypothetical protein
MPQRKLKVNQNSIIYNFIETPSLFPYSLLMAAASGLSS